MSASSCRRPITYQRKLVISHILTRASFFLTTLSAASHIARKSLHLIPRR
jgi:hypothetical protein